jgi:LytR cell envelope-related transcriptional attenuator
MNQRESSGLPLRAMVMVLLFLGVVFLLVAIQSVTSDDNSGANSASSSTSATSSAAPTTSTTPAPVNVQVLVLNVSDVSGAAQTVTDKLHEAKFNVGDPGNLILDQMPPATTVYFDDGPGEKDTADAVGKLLQAPVEPRTQIAALSGQPADVVIVLVTG